MKLTGSGIDRARACIASVALPHSRAIREASTLGTVIHEYLMNVSLVGKEEALKRVPEAHQDTCAAIDLEQLPQVDPRSYAAEVAYAYSTANDTGRELGRAINRAYEGLEPGDVPCTLDSVGLTEDAVVVIDWKTGWAEVPAPAENWQLRFGALAASRTHGRRRAHVAIGRIREGEVTFEWGELDELDLETTAAELRDLVERQKEEEERLRDGRPPRTVTGPHCKYCNAFPYCPAQAGLLRELVVASVGDQPAPIITPENAPELLRKYEAVSLVVKRFGEVLDAYATRTPIPLENGEVYGRVIRKTETVDPIKGAAILGERFGLEVANAAVKNEPTLPKNRMEIAIRAWMAEHPGNKFKVLERELWKLFREHHAVVTSESESVKRHRPKPEAKPKLAEAELPEGEKGEAA